MLGPKNRSALLLFFDSALYKYLNCLYLLTCKHVGPQRIRWQQKTQTHQTSLTLPKRPQSMGYYVPRPRGTQADCFGIARSIRLSVPWRSFLGYRHAVCLQLSHRRPPEFSSRAVNKPLLMTVEARTRTRTRTRNDSCVSESNSVVLGRRLGAVHQVLFDVRGRPISAFTFLAGWLGSQVVSVLDSGAEGLGFKSQLRPRRVTVLGKLFTPIVPLFTKQQNWQQPSQGLRGQLRAWRKVMAAYRRVYDSRHPQADCQEPGSAPEPYAR